MTEAEFNTGKQAFINMLTPKKQNNVYGADILVANDNSGSFEVQPGQAKNQFEVDNANPHKGYNRFFK